MIRVIQNAQSGMAFFDGFDYLIRTKTGNHDMDNIICGPGYLSVNNDYSGNSRSGDLTPDFLFAYSSENL